MTTSFRPLEIRRVLGRETWRPPVEYGPDGWRFDTFNPLARGRVLVSCGAIGPDESDTSEWFHASMSFRDRVPTYDELVLLHHAVWGVNGWAYHVFAPAAKHINITANVLHLWGRPDGRPELPDFGWMGSI